MWATSTVWDQIAAPTVLRVRCLQLTDTASVAWVNHKSFCGVKGSHQHGVLSQANTCAALVSLDGSISVSCYTDWVYKSIATNYVC